MDNMDALRRQIKREDACHRRARKYKVINTAVIWVLMVGAIVCLFLPIHFAFTILLILLAIGVMFGFEIGLQRFILRILTVELDPFCYLTVINELRLKSKYGTEEMSALVAMGKFEEAIALQKEKAPKVKQAMLRAGLYNDAVRAYFRMGDLEGMEKSICLLEELFEKEDPRGVVKKTFGASVENFKHFLRGEYEACCAYKDAVLEQTPQPLPYVRVTLDYAYGVSCYCKGDFAQAELIFAEIANAAPLTAEGRLASTFLKAIEEQPQQPMALCQISRRAFES